MIWDTELNFRSVYEYERYFSSIQGALLLLYSYVSSCSVTHIINPILLGWSHTPDFIRGGDKFVLHPRITESLKEKC